VELYNLLRDFFTVEELRVALDGFTAKDIRDELGLVGLGGLRVAAKLREALNRHSIVGKRF